MAKNTAKAEASDIVIENNIALRVDTFFSNNLLVNGAQIRSNTVNQCGNNCVTMAWATRMVLEGNVFLRDQPEKLFLYGTTDVMVKKVRDLCFRCTSQRSGLMLCSRAAGLYFGHHKQRFQQEGGIRGRS
jgi:hypothetical protein